jgi:DNA-binding PadR family transcriptional regulator
MLGLLAVRPWTTYELAKQMQRSVRWFWARAERKLYDEPKHLAARGLATTRSTMTGKRASTVYEITAAGRAALRQWMATPEFAPPQIEMEGLLHVFFAENGTPDELVAALRRIGTHATDALAELHLMSAAIASGDDQFPERRAMNAVSIELWARLHEATRDWSTWAEREVTSWPSVRRGRRMIAAGPPTRGNELFAMIADRTTPP